MVERNDSDETSCGGNGTIINNYDYFKDIGSTEEHALAWVSREYRRESRLKKHPLIEQRDARRGIRPQNSSYLGSYQPSGFPLSVDFNVDPSISTESAATTTTTETPPTIIVTSEKLNWDRDQTEGMLSYFFFGYIVFQLPAARSAELFGTKSLFVMSGFGNAFCSLIFPIACKMSFYYAAFARILMGCFQATIFPAAYALLCEWLPKNERSKWLPVPSAFSRFGTIAMNLALPGILSSSGWEMVYYVSGGVTLIWTVIFMVFASSSPNESYWISKSELMHIESHMEPRVGKSDLTSQTSKPRLSWSKLITNRAVLLLSLVMFTSEWSNMLLLIKLPGFLGKVHNMPTSTYSKWSTVLVSLYCVQFPLSGYVASKLESSGKLSSLQIRKLFEFTAHFIQAIGSLIIALSCDTTVTIGALILMMVGRSTVGGGQCLMPPELSRDYSGTVFAYANSIANVAGFIGPRLLPYIVLEEASHASWAPFWFLSAALFLTVGIIFCLFAENETQNYCKKPKARPGKAGAGNEAFEMAEEPEIFEMAEEPEIFKMDAFGRVMSEPSGNRPVLLKSMTMTAPVTANKRVSKWD